MGLHFTHILTVINGSFAPEYTLRLDDPYLPRLHDHYFLCNVLDGKVLLPYFLLRLGVGGATFANRTQQVLSMTNPDFKPALTPERSAVCLLFPGFWLKIFRLSSKNIAMLPKTMPKSWSNIMIPVWRGCILFLLCTQRKIYFKAIWLSSPSSREEWESVYFSSLRQAHSNTFQCSWGEAGRNRGRKGGKSKEVCFGLVMHYNQNGTFFFWITNS